MLRLLALLRALPSIPSRVGEWVRPTGRRTNARPARRPRRVALKRVRPPKLRMENRQRPARPQPRLGAKVASIKASLPKRRPRALRAKTRETRSGWGQLAFLNPKMGRILLVMVAIFNLVPLLVLQGPPALAGVVTYGGNIGTGLGEPCTATGTQDTVSLDADTYADDTQPNTNMGTSGGLQAGNPSGNTNIAYLHFPLPTPPAGCDVSSASLRMYKRTGGPHNAQLARAASSWDENTLTWNNRPGTTGTPTTISTFDGQNQWGVTSLIRSFYWQGVPNDGLVITDTFSNMSRYDSREADPLSGGIPPQLVVTWGGSAGTSLTLDVTSNVPRGNSVIVSYVAVNSGPGPVTATDSQGNVYSVDSDRMTSDSGRVVLLSAHSVRSLGPGDTITISHPFSGGRAASANQFSGLTPTNTLDQTSTGEGVGTSVGTGTVNTTQANELIVGSFGVDGTTAQFTRGSGFSGTPSVVAPGDGSLHTEYRIVSSTGAYTANGSLSVSTGWAGAMATYKVDMTAPAVTINNPAGGATTSDTTPTITGTAGSERSDSDTVTVRIYSGPNTSGPLVQTATATRDAGGNWSVDSSLLSDGQYTVRATQTDNATNAANSSPVTFRVDATAPGMPVLDGPPSPGNNASPQWTFSGEAGAPFECRLEKGGVVVETLANCTSPKQFTLDDGDGTYTFFVRQTDQAGNASSFAWRDYTLDTNAPSTPNVGGASGKGNNATPQWTFSGEASATFQCRLEKDGAVVSPNAPCTSPKSYTLGAGDGQYTFFVTQTDQAGNTSNAASRSYELDTGVPETQIESGPSGPTPNNSPSFSFSSPEGGVTFECRLDGAAFSTCTSPRSFSGLSDGSHTFRVRALDGAGNVDATPAERTFMVDTVNPALPTIVGPTSPGNNPSPQWGFSGESSAVFECRLEKGGSVVEPTSTCTSPQQYDLTDGDGTYTFFARQIDEAGNVSGWRQHEYVLDTNDPEAPAITRPSGRGNNLAVTLEFNSEPGATTECRLLKGTEVIETFTTCTSPDIYNLVDGDGTYTFIVRQTDAAGNVSPEASQDYELDTGLPNTTIDSGPTGSTSNTDPSFGFSSDEAGSAFECELDGSGFAPCTTPRDYTALSDGPHTFRVRATDTAGNTDPTPAERTFTVDTGAPTVTIDSMPQDPGNDSTPTWDFTTESGATLDCRLSAGGVSVSPWGPCDAGTATFDLSSQNDNTYLFEVRTTDAAGNWSLASDTHLLDREDPQSDATSPALTNDTDFDITYSHGDSLSGVKDVELWVRGPNDSAYELVDTDWTLSSSFAYSATQGDGTYRFYTRAIDRADNKEAAPAGSDSVTVIDTQAPEATINSAPSDPTNDSPFVLSFSSTDGSATFECSMTDDGSTSYAPCTSSSTYPDSGDGTYTFKVRATDSAGNTGSADTTTFEYDQTAPAMPNLTGPVTPGNDTTPEWSFTGEPNATFECRLEKGGSVVASTALCANPQEYILSDGDGTYTFLVRQIDEAGNASPFEQHEYELDTAVPTAPQINGPAPTGNDTSVELDFTIDAGSTAECKVMKGTQVIQDFTSCNSPESITFSDGDGTYTLVVRQTDQAGNVSPEASQDYILDTGVPNTQIDAGPSGPVSTDSPSFGFSSNEAGVSFECNLDGAGWNNCNSPKEYNSLSQGSHTFQVRAFDAAGNVDSSPSLRSFIVDTVNPNAPVINGPASPDNDVMPDWAFTGEASATFECRLERGGSVVSPTSGCTDPFDQALTDGDGVYTLSVRQIDQAGNVSPWAQATYELDTVAPQTQIDSGPQGSTSNPDPSFSISSPENGMDFECDLDGIGWFSCTDPVDFSALADGPHDFSVRAVDDAGNADPSPATRLFQVDTNAPPTPVVTGPNSPTNNSSPQWSFSGESGGSFECRVERNGQQVNGTAACSSPGQFNLSDGDGTYTFFVRQLDDAGNSSPWASDNVQLDTTAPNAPNVTSPSGNGSTPNVTLAFTKAPDTVAECSLVKGNQVIHNWRTCASPEAYNLSDGDGTYTFFVRQTDDAGNVSPDGTQSYDLDTRNPETTIDSGPNGLTNNANPSFNFSSDESNVVFECELDGAGFTACNSPEYLASLSDGTHTFRVRARDRADNVDPTPAERTITVDTGAPQVNIDTAPATPDNDARPRWNFSTEQGATLDCQLSFGGQVLVPFQSCNSGTIAYDLQGDGDYTFTVRSTDAAGNWATAVDTYTFDTGLPDSVAWAPGLTSETDFDLTYTVADGLSTIVEVELWVRGPDNAGFQLVGTDTTPDSPAFTYTATQGDGTYEFYTRALDEAGNREAVPVDPDATTTLDTSPPDVTINSAPDNPTERAPFRFTFSSSDPDAEYECSLTTDGSDEYLPCDSPITYPATNGLATYTFKVRTADQIGNLGEPATYAFNYIEEQVTTSPSPTPTLTETTEPPPPPPPPTETPTVGPTEQPPPPPPPDAPEPDPRPAVKEPDPKPTRVDPPKEEREQPKEPKPTPPAPEEPKEEKEPDLADLATATVKAFGFPLLLALLVAAYLMVQYWLDRKDPKLAMAPVHAKHDLARFV